MRPIAEATSRITGKSFSRKYIALGRVVNSWQEIVGADLALKAQPVQIRYSKPQPGKNPSVTLDIATSSADATLLHYQKDLIIERINQLFGAGWITGIRFVHETSNMKKVSARKSKKPLTEHQKTYLSEVLDAIADEDIKSRLGSLGQAVIMEHTTETKKP